MKTLIACGTKYGSTMTIGQWIAERLPFGSQVCDIKYAPSPDDFELVILGSAIYEGKTLPQFDKYIDTYFQILQQRKTAIFVVCLDTKGVFVKGRVHGGWNYIMPIINRFKTPPIHAGIMHGEINPSKLTPEDTEKLMHFYNQILHRNYSTPPYRTMMNKQEAWEFAEQILKKLKGERY